MKSDPRPVPRALVPPPLFVSGCLAPLGSQGLWAPPPCSRGASPGKGRGGQEAGLGGGARSQAELGLAGQEKKDAQKES